MTIPKEVVLEALRCCRDVYPHKQDYLVSRKIDGHTILAVEGTNEKTLEVIDITPSSFCCKYSLVRKGIF